MSITTRVAFHVRDGELVRDSVRIRGNVILVEVVMPRTDENGERMAPREAGGLWADPKIGAAVFNDQQITLTRVEMRILLCLMDAYPSGATLEDIRKAISAEGTSLSIKGAVGRLRKALKGIAKVPAVWGVGYMLVPPDDLEQP